MCCNGTSAHEKKWYFSLPSNEDENICLACIVLSLEDKQLLNVRKKIILQKLHEILHSSPQIIIKIIEHEEEVQSHIILVLLGYCCGSVEHLVKISTECLLLFLIHAKKEKLRLAVAQKLTVGIQQECNFVRSLTHFHLLGRLFQLFPDLIRECLNQNSQFIRYVANGMAHQSEEVRSTIVYIFLQIYSSNFSAGNSVIAEIDFFIAKGILYVLESGITKDVIKNGLALLKVFISKDSKRVTLLFENLNEEANFLAVIRKIILSSDAAFQVCIVQCICFILSEKNEDIYIRKLIEGNVPELLFEVITGTNELLLETIFCCLVLFTHSPHFFEKCHILYSISTILEATVALLNLKNMKLLALAFNLLISLVSNDNYLVATSTQTSLFQKALQLFEKTYKVHSPQVLLSANKLLFYLLKKESLSSFKFPLPLVQLFDILLSCLKNVQKYLSSHLLSSPQFRNSFENNMDDLPLEIKILINGLDIIYFFIQILKHQTKNPMSMEEIFSCPDVQNKSKSTAKINVQSVMQAIIDALDQIFVPCCLMFRTTQRRR
ncbi:hypothetical protein JTE90_020915 [Oedothorax gibbosus]|uniref:Uncharacterized protein n=1 Tax=Oedothorax gibbosus TaxID=931172 RepID=A0AAV6VRE9_9ARAC|nr:hypothetical protein JTE90_020915 [Oedothorax gibbosus]